MSHVRLPLIFACLGLTIIAVLSSYERGPALAWASLIGGVAGFALYHASFGFTAAWRRIVREKRGSGLRAQIILILMTCVVSFPMIHWGSGVFAASGYILPIGVASAIGAFVFGIGMQLGGGCASGTLFTAGGGSIRMMITLAAFITGSVIATFHWGFWTTSDGSVLRDVLSYRFNNNRGISLIATFGPIGALSVMTTLFGAIYLATLRIETSYHQTLDPMRATTSILRGPWSVTLGAIVLAGVSIATFVVLGRPWGVTSAFALWGAKMWQTIGGTPEHWLYWSGWRTGQLNRSVLADATSVMNFGIVFGAMAAASLAGKWAPNWNLSQRDIWTAIIGGLLMGYGARLAYGCNIGAYLGGLVSGSAHGIWWLIWGFAGSYLGTWLRDALSMDPPVTHKPA